MALSNEARKLVRTVIKQVHPDLFPSNPFERQSNTEALKVGGGAHFGPCGPSSVTAAGGLVKRCG
jgi:hypothetical protein